MAGSNPATNTSPQPIRSSRRISQKLDFVHTLPNLVENRDTALEKRPSVQRGLDAACAAIEEANSERTLQLRNRLGCRRLSETQLARRFRDAAPLHDGVEELQVTQPQSPTDDLSSLHWGSSHMKIIHNSMTTLNFLF
jgi:hypothetical protein